MVHIKNRILVYGTYVVLAFLLLFSCNTPVYATEAAGSLTAVCKSTQGGETVYLGGDIYALIQIAKAELMEDSIKYKTRTEFKEYDCDWSALTSSQRNEKAKMLEQVVKTQEIYTLTAVSNSQGSVRFENLEPGLYLLLRVKIASNNMDFVCDPALYSIPVLQKHIWVHEISVSPKFVRFNPSQPEKLPQTGQLKWPIPLLVLSGMIFFFVGFELRYGRRNKNA